MKKVAVIMGSDSDWSVVKGACTQLEALGIPYEAHILSAHRTPAAAADFAKGARTAGFGAVICAAMPAAQIKAPKPFFRAFLAKSAAWTGVRWALMIWASKGMPN